MDNRGNFYWPEKQTLPKLNKPAEVLDMMDFSDVTPDEMTLFTTLKGIVNRTTPRIYTRVGKKEEQYEWPDILNLKYVEVEDLYSLILKYRSEIKGLIIYDEAVIDTLNLATSIAGAKDGVVVSAELAEKLSAEPYSLPVLYDLRGQFDNKLDVYRHLLKEWYPQLTHRLIAGINPETVRGHLREYIVALGMACIWLQPDEEDEKDLLNEFLSALPAGSVYMGWWVNEEAGIAAASVYGVACLASDWSVNLTVLGGIESKTVRRPAPKIPEVENKIYVSFIVADGDNLQYMENAFKGRWKNPDRGSVPLGWTTSPTMVDAAPALLDWIYSTATDNDCLVSGPSGIAYTYPNIWSNKDHLKVFMEKTDDYMQRAGLRVLTLWAHGVNGATNDDVGEMFAKYSPSLLGITSQKRDSGWKIYDGTMPGAGIWGNYCSKVIEMEESIELGSREYDGTAPVFILIQPVPWQLSPTEVKNLVAKLGPEYEVVRPDIMFAMFRKYNNMVVDPLEK